MATPAQNEALDLKRRARRRLVGAIALVLFLVIVPPLVMDLEPKPVSTSLQVEIPQQSGAPLALPEPAAPESATETPAPASEPAAPSAPEATPSSPKENEVKRAEAETKRAEAILNQEGVFYIQVATLSKKESVRQLQSKLSQAGIKSYTEPVKTASGEHTRVRAGPFPSKEAAEKARGKLQQMGLKPGSVSAK